MYEQQITSYDLPAIIILMFFFAGIYAGIVVAAKFRARSSEWRIKVSDLISRPWNYNDTGLLLVAALLPVSLIQTAAFIAIKFGNMSINDIEAPATAVQTGLMHGLVLLTAWNLYKRKNVSPDEAFGIKKQDAAENISQGLIGYLAILPLVAAGAYLTILLTRSCGIKTEMQEPIRMLTGNYPVYLKAFLVFAACITAPLAEEILFRGAALPVLSRKTGTPAAIFLISFAFAAIHQNISAFLPIFVLSAGLSIAYVTSGSLLTSIIMHAAFNAVSLLTTAVMNPDQLPIR